MSDKTGF